MDFCKKCLLPETYPKLYLNSEGYCNVCVAYEQKFKNYDPVKAEQELRKKLEEASRKNNKLVVTCSGGIDSSYVLYLCRTKYNLDIIGAHFDHGFQSKAAQENLHNLSESLHFPIITVKPNLDILYKLYRDFLLRTGDFCTPCCQGCCRVGFIVAGSHNIQTIIHGGVSGSRIEFNVLGMLKHHYERFMKIIEDDYSSEELQALLTPTDEIKKFNLISLPQYIHWDEREIINLLKNEFKWKPLPNGRTRYVDCLIADVADYFLQRKFGFSRQWMIVSANIRAGFIDPEQGRIMIKSKEAKITEEPREAINILLDKTMLTRKQIEGLPFYTSEPAVRYLR
ncbi:hypothetical protein AMJ52_05940 [candidate division TA06 bacterium DG_78]|uniref:Uncharacterized protein n=1 Tax=candidate division TA06 bacterium DG_78 TaxID=1703772 RepID=A0A0S7YCL9_UNCT6|nr:MAG: hypothetical protein AMJ52_05940 [candidate division TA06 bacterium DG_78]